MKQLAIAAAVSLLATASFAQTATEGRQLAEMSFDSVDTEGRGFVDLGQLEQQRDAVFASMDADDNGRLSEEEFTSWGYGFQNIAETENKQLAYKTALRIVFSFWDRDNDGGITPSEHRKAIIADFQRADVSNDAILDKSEFLNGFSVLVAIRAALKPHQ